MQKQRQAMIEIFEQSGKAHALAFTLVDGEDPDWALWYAEFLQQPLSKILGQNLTRTQVALCLIAAEEERQTVHGKDHPWPELYADHFVQRYSPANPVTETNLALYYYPECPYCQRVLRAIRETGTKVELRHIWENPPYRAELQAARGRTTVPVLRIMGSGEDRWMPESADIVRYLQERRSVDAG